MFQLLSLSKTAVAAEVVLVLLMLYLFLIQFLYQEKGGENDQLFNKKNLITLLKCVAISVNNKEYVDSKQSNVLHKQKAQQTS